jgi:hypothetical protein
MSRYAKADKTSMNTTHDLAPGPDDPIFNAHVISHAVSTIRRAQGKLLPRDCEEGSTQWRRVMEDFAHDVMRALDAQP